MISIAIILSLTFQTVLSDSVNSLANSAGGPSSFLTESPNSLANLPIPLTNSLTNSSKISTSKSNAPTDVTNSTANTANSLAESSNIPTKLSNHSTDASNTSANSLTNPSNLLNISTNSSTNSSNSLSDPANSVPNSIWYPLPRGFNQSNPDGTLELVATANIKNIGLPFKDFYVFGDSACDTGNLFVLNNYLDPSPNIYWKGRFSNGPMWPDYLQSIFNMRRTNYAYGGATVLNSNYQNGNNIPDLPRQISNYRTSNFNSSRPLAILQFVGNDMIGKNVTSVQVANDIANQLGKLIGFGEIHNILILGTAVQAYDEMGFNTALKNMVQSFQSSHTKIAINFFPLLDIFADMSKTPPVTSDKGKWIVSPSSCYNQNTGSLCRDPGNYLLFDLYHPSTVPNFNIANYIGQAIKNLPWV